MGVNVDTMTADVAISWLLNGKYAHFTQAELAVVAALEAIFLRNGEKVRVIHPESIGEDAYVLESTGHDGLITHWERGVVEKVAGVRKTRRTGNV